MDVRNIIKRDAINLVKLSAVGLINTILSYSTFVGCHSILKMSTQSSLTISYISAIAVYTVNARKYVFKQDTTRLSHFSKTALVFLWSYGFQSTSLWFWEPRTDMGPNLIVLFNVVFLYPINYLILKLFVFKTVK